MKKIPGKLVVVDDDELEKALLERALRKKEWDAEIEYFSIGDELLDYLRDTQDPIFLIICDYKLPGMTGLELKKIIDQDEELGNKAIPFVFASLVANQQQVMEAYEYRVQGYFEKPTDLNLQTEMLDNIINYWMINQHPQKIELDC